MGVGSLLNVYYLENTMMRRLRPEMDIKENPTNTALVWSQPKKVGSGYCLYFLGKKVQEDEQW